MGDEDDLEQDAVRHPEPEERVDGQGADEQPNPNDGTEQDVRDRAATAEWSKQEIATHLRFHQRSRELELGLGPAGAIPPAQHVARHRVDKPPGFGCVKWRGKRMHPRIIACRPLG